MIPAANKPEIDICMDPPTIIRGILGGIVIITALEPVAAESSGISFSYIAGSLLAQWRLHRPALNQKYQQKHTGYNVHVS